MPHDPRLELAPDTFDVANAISELKDFPDLAKRYYEGALHALSAEPKSLTESVVFLNVRKQMNDIFTAMVAINIGLSKREEDLISERVIRATMEPSFVDALKDSILFCVESYTKDNGIHPTLEQIQQHTVGATSDEVNSTIHLLRQWNMLEEIMLGGIIMYRLPIKDEQNNQEAIIHG